MTLEQPTLATLAKTINFRQGQIDRKNGKPCTSANGAYLDGWYSPEKTVPPYVTQAEMEVFNL